MESDRRATVGGLGNDARVAAAHPLPFFSTETRQVWAQRKDTGEPYYLGEGGASQAKAVIDRLRCLSPECDVRIIAIGGRTRRHHFRHHHGGCPATGGESALHLAGKAMLAAWLRENAPDGSTVVIEQRIHPRRPDVVVTDRDGSRTAYEVEYKSWGVEDWEAKQADLDAADVAVVWLIGHNRFTPFVPENIVAEDGAARIRVPALAQAIAASQNPVLAINPLTREIGTLISVDSRLYRGTTGEARIATDSIDECRFDPRLGIVTPTLDRLLEREREIAERQRAEAERIAQQLASAGPERGPDPAPVHPIPPPAIAINRPRPVSTWSALRVLLIERWGDVPAALGDEASVAPGIDAQIAHWRAALHEVLLHERGSDFAFTVDDAIWALSQYEITVRDGAKARAAIESWLGELVALGLVHQYTYDRPGDRFRFFTASEATVGGARTAPRPYAEYVDTLQRRLRALGDRTDDGQRKIASLNLGWLTRPVAFRDGVVRWVPRTPWLDVQIGSPWAAPGR
jgi:hypothetical protein